MVKLGIPLPAKSAKIGFYDEVVADVGDGQSVEFGLSTFAARVRTWTSALKCRHKVLVLLDELGSSTEPEASPVFAPFF